MWESIREILPQVLVALIVMLVLGHHLIFSVPKSIGKKTKDETAECKPEMTVAEFREKLKKTSIISWIAFMLAFIAAMIVVSFIF